MLSALGERCGAPLSRYSNLPQNRPIKAEIEDTRRHTADKRHPYGSSTHPRQRYNVRNGRSNVEYLLLRPHRQFVSPPPSIATPFVPLSLARAHLNNVCMRSCPLSFPIPVISLGHGYLSMLCAFSFLFSFGSSVCFLVFSVVSV